MDMPRNAGVIRIIISGFKHHLAIFKHLEKLVHLNGMQFADFIQKQHTPMCFADSSGFGLRNALHTKRPCTLINGVVHRADQRVRNSSFIKTDAGRIHLNKRRILSERRAGRLPCSLQHQASRAGFANTRWAVNQHMLRVRAAQNRLERLYSVLLANDILKFRRPHLFRKRFRQVDAPHGVELVHLPATFPPCQGLHLFLLFKLAVEIHAHHHRHQHLNSDKNPVDHTLSLHFWR